MAPAAVCVGVWVIGIFVNLSGKPTQQIIDRGLNKRDIAEIENTLQSFNEVEGYHKIRTRPSGSTIFIDMHVKVDRDLNIEMAGDLTKRIERKIEEMFLLTNILIHIEPLYDNLGAKAEKPDRRFPGLTYNCCLAHMDDSTKALTMMQGMFLGKVGSPRQGPS